MSFTTKSRIKMQQGNGFKKAPEVVYKPKPPVAKLSAEEAAHLHNIAYGGLMRTVTPEHISETLLKQGYIRNAVGGTVATDAGHRLLAKVKK